MLTGCDGTGAHYTAYVDEVEPEIPGLKVEGTKAIWGAIYIENDTGMDVYIYYYRDGRELYKITATDSFGKNEQGDWVHYRKANSITYSSPPVEYAGSADGLPDGRYHGQVMKEWVIEGRAGDTPFKIYGRMVYEPVR